MKRIALTKAEKQVLRMVLAGQEVCPAEYPAHQFNTAVRALEGYGLVRGAYTEGGGVEAVEATQYARQYIAENPRLRAPLDLKWVISTAIAVISAAAAIVALFVACTMI